MATFSRDIDRRPTACELLRYMFVVANSAAAEAIAAGNRGFLERRNAPPVVAQPAVRHLTGLPSVEIKEIRTVEEAADQTLARQATGLLGEVN